MVAQTQNKEIMEDYTLSQIQLIIGDALADVYYKTGNSPSKVLAQFEKLIREDERKEVLLELFEK